MKVSNGIHLEDGIAECVFRDNTRRSTSPQSAERLDKSCPPRSGSRLNSPSENMIFLKVPVSPSHFGQVVSVCCRLLQRTRTAGYRGASVHVWNTGSTVRAGGKRRTNGEGWRKEV